MTASPGTPYTPIDFQMDTPSRVLYENGLQQANNSARLKTIADSKEYQSRSKDNHHEQCSGQARPAPADFQTIISAVQGSWGEMASPFDKQDWLDFGTFLQRHPTSTPLVLQLRTLWGALNEYTQISARCQVRDEYVRYFDEAAGEVHDCFSQVTSIVGECVQKLELRIQKPLGLSRDT